jgi:hypothetical protein
MNNITVLEFRFLHLDDEYNKKYVAWSRIYEYPIVLHMLSKLGADLNSNIHNTCWGFEGCHVTFKNDLDSLYKNTIHSDVRQYNIKNTMIYDITKKIDNKFVEYFDFVLNISTIEEVKYSNIDIINNLFEQVRPGGYLIITFDYDKDNCNTCGNGSINLSVIENYIGKKIESIKINSINGSNSILPNNLYNNLNCGILVLQKVYTDIH